MTDKEGWQWVPKKATQEMCHALWGARSSQANIARMWDAALAASPSPPSLSAAGATEEMIGQELRLWSVEQRRQTVKVDPTGNSYEEWWVVLRAHTEHSRHDDKFEASEEMYDALARAILALTHNPAGVTEEEIARTLYDADYRPGNFDEDKRLAKRDGLKWPTFTKEKYYKYASAILGLTHYLAATREGEK